MLVDGLLVKERSTSTYKLNLEIWRFGNSEKIKTMTTFSSGKWKRKTPWTWGKKKKIEGFELAGLYGWLISWGSTERKSTIWR